MDEGTPVARILEVLAAHPEGLAQADLQRAVGGSLEELALGINDLLQNGRIELSRKGGTNFYKYIDPDLAAKFKGLTAEERLIYQLIEAEKDMGLWTRDMKYKSNLQQTQINKILRVLVQRKLIKAVKSIAGRNKKVYMLYDLEPSVKVKGNAFYTADGLFDAEFVAVLNKQCEQYIASKGWTTLADLCAYVQNSGISNVELREEDIQTIVNTLIYDGKVEQIKHGASLTPGQPAYFFKPSKLSLPRNVLTEIPCGQCPVYNFCEEEGDITPARCPYLQAWLDQQW